MQIATWPPAYAHYRNPWELGVFELDVARFARAVRGQLRAGPSRLEINPRSEDVAAVVSKAGYVTVDIECGPEHADSPWTAKFPARARLRTIGLGNADWALSYRWDGGCPAVREAIGRLLEDRRVLKVYQNGPWYDIPVLRRYSLNTVSYDDTRDMRKALSATSRLGLKYLATLYDDCPPWAEEEGEEGDKVVFTQDWEKLQTYNAYDCIETARVYEGMLAEADWDTPRVKELYRVFHRLSHIAANMHAVGMMVDEEKRAWLDAHLLAEYDKREKALIERVDIPGFRCTPNDMRALIYKRHATPEISRFNLDDPLSPKAWASENSIKVDQGTLLKLFVDPGTPSDLREIITLYWQAEGVWKARSTSVVSDTISQAIGADGRLRPSWNSCGTDTGRFACRAPNVMTLSKAKGAATNLGGDLPNLRQMYRAKPGFILMEADFSQLELRVMAAVAEDEVLQEALLMGDVYAADARDIFRLPAVMPKCKCEGKCENPQGHISKAARQLAKIVHLAYQYGAGTDTIFGQSIEVDRSLKYNAVRLVHEGMKKRYSRTVAYWYEEQDRVKATGYSESRILNQRRVYPREPPITEVANYPVQSTASDISNLALIKVDENLRRVSREAAILGQFHDAFLFEVPEDEASIKRVAAYVRECMEQKHTINGRECSFPVEVKWGTHWSSC